MMTLDQCESKDFESLRKEKRCVRKKTRVRCQILVNSQELHTQHIEPVAIINYNHRIPVTTKVPRDFHYTMS